MGHLWRILKTAISGFLANDALSRGGAIAFYAATSLAPVLLIIVAIAGIAFGQDAARAAISDELGQLVGPTGGDFIKSILAQSSDPSTGMAATIVGIITVLITASGVFGEMHTALNATFKAKPTDLFCDPDARSQPRACGSLGVHADSVACGQRGTFRSGSLG
jgi:membrane protein